MLSIPPPPPPPPPPPRQQSESASPKKMKSRSNVRDPGGLTSKGVSLISGADPDGNDTFRYVNTDSNVLKDKYQLGSGPVDSDEVIQQMMKNNMPTPVHAVKNRKKNPDDNDNKKLDATTHSNDAETGPPTPMRRSKSTNRDNGKTPLNSSNNMNLSTATTASSTTRSISVADVSLLIGPPPPPPTSPPPSKTPIKKRSKSHSKKRSKTPSGRVETREDSLMNTGTKPRSTSATPTQRILEATDPDELLTDAPHIQEINIATSTSMSTITHAHTDFEDSIIEQRLRAVREKNTDIMSDDPPTGSAYVGRRYVAPTPRMTMEHSTEQIASQFTCPTPVISVDLEKKNNMKLPHNSTPVKVITVSSPLTVPFQNKGPFETQDTQKRAIYSDFGTVDVPSTSSEPLSISVATDKSKVGLSEDKLTATAEFLFAKTSVQTIAPSVDIRADSEAFHPHSSAFHRGSGEKQQRYRSKTPERLRRMNESVTKNNTPQRQNFKGKNTDKIANDEFTAKTVESLVQQPPPKKGFFKKLFGGSNHKKKEKGSDKSTVTSASTYINQFQEIDPTNASDTSYEEQPHGTIRLASDIPDNKSSNNVDLIKKERTTLALAQENQSNETNTTRQNQSSFLNTNEVSCYHDDLVSTIHSTEHDHSEFYMGNDEVSTITMQTGDSFVPFGNTLYNNVNYLDMKSNRDNSEYSTRRREDPSVQSTNTSDPMGLYWEKDTDHLPSSIEPFNPFGAPFFDQLSPTPNNKRDLTAKSSNTKESKVNARTDIEVESTNNHTSTAFPFAKAHIQNSSSRLQNSKFAKSKYEAPTNFSLPQMGLCSDQTGEARQHDFEGAPKLEVGVAPVPDPDLFLQSLDDSIDDHSSDSSDSDIDVAALTSSEFIDVELEQNNEYKNDTKPYISSAAAAQLENEKHKKDQMQIHSVGSETPKIQNTKPKDSFFLTNVNAKTNTKGKRSGNKANLPPVSVSHASDPMAPTLSKKQRATEIHSAERNVRAVDAASALLRNKKIAKVKTSIHTSMLQTDNETGPIDSDEVILAMNSTEVKASVEPSIARKAVAISGMGRAHRKLNVSTAARANAKTVAYIHNLKGDPSPRSLWRDSGMTDDGSLSPAPVTRNKEPTTEIHSPKADSNNNSPTSSTRSKRLLQTKKSRLRKKLSPTGSVYSYRQNPHQNASKVESITPNERNVIQRSFQTTSKEECITSGQNSSVVPEAIHFFSAYNPRFKSRKPILQSQTIRSASPRMETDFSFVTGVPKHLQLLSPRPKLEDTIEVTTTAFERGVMILRNNRERNIAMGKSKRVIPMMKEKKLNQNESTFKKDAEPRDPIQRASRRLLAKAAIPIQSHARRFLAQREAVDRLWGILEIQSYVRRWKAEAAVLAYRHSVIKIQTRFRGYLLRKALCIRKTAAVMIQKIARGYMVSIMTYHVVYRIILIQAHFRGFAARRKIEKCEQETRTCAATKIQALWRGYSLTALYRNLLVDTVMMQTAVRRWFGVRRVAQKRAERREVSAVMIQKTWRSYQAYTSYIFLVVDILIVQRSVRAWQAKKEATRRRRSKSALQIQTKWRQYAAYKSYLLSLVYIIIIQSSIRAFRAKKEIHLLRTDVNATIIQRNVRRCQSKSIFYHLKAEASATIIQREVRRLFVLRRYRIMRGKILAATRIQSQWRSNRAQLAVLHKLIRIILVQSVVRRFLSRRIATDRSKECAAVKIQATWRRFWDFSHYVILVYEITRLQARVRGKIALAEYNLKLGCCIIVQSTARKYIASKNFRKIKKVKESNAASRVQRWWRVTLNLLQRERIRNVACIVIQSSIRQYLGKKCAYMKRLHASFIDSIQYYELREYGAVTRIQLWWHIVAKYRREKRAALVIERFFLMIKTEIEHEIFLREKRRSTKNKSRREHFKEKTDDKLLERVWQSTVDDGASADPFLLSVRSSVATPNAGRPRSSEKANRNQSPHYRQGADHFTSSTAQSPASPIGRSDEKRVVSHRASSPTMNLVMRHDINQKYRKPSPIVHVEDEASVLSGLTFLTSTGSAKRVEYSADQRSRPLDREHLNAEARVCNEKQATGSQSAAEKYMKMYGIKNTAGRASRINHFFADDLESTTSSLYSPQATRNKNSSTLKAAAILQSYKGSIPCLDQTSTDLKSPNIHALRVHPAPYSTNTEGSKNSYYDDMRRAVARKADQGGRYGATGSTNAYRTIPPCSTMQSGGSEQLPSDGLSMEFSQLEYSRSDFSPSGYVQKEGTQTSQHYSGNPSSHVMQSNSRVRDERVRTPVSSSIQQSASRSGENRRDSNPSVQTKSIRSADRSRSVLPLQSQSHYNSNGRSRSAVPIRSSASIDDHSSNTSPSHAYPAHQMPQRSRFTSSSTHERASPRHNNIVVMSSSQHSGERSQRHPRKCNPDDYEYTGKEYGMI